MRLQLLKYFKDTKYNIFHKLTLFDIRNKNNYGIAVYYDISKKYLYFKKIKDCCSHSVPIIKVY